MYNKNMKKFIKKQTTRWVCILKYMINIIKKVKFYLWIKKNKKAFKKKNFIY